MILLGQYWGDELSYKVYCDECDEYFEDLSENMDSFIVAIKAYGWSVPQIKKDCNHYCRKCTERHYENI